MRAFIFIMSLLAACTTTSPTSTSAPAPAPAPVGGKPAVSTYVAGASSATMYTMIVQPDGTMKKQESKKLDQQETAALLAGYDLDRPADGPLVRCPSDTLYELADAAGKRLGTIGLCQGAARFDAPDGTFGGLYPR